LKLASGLLAAGLRGLWGAFGSALIFAGGELFAAIDHRQVRHHDAEVRRSFFAGFSGSVPGARLILHERRTTVRSAFFRALLGLRVRLLGVAGIGITRAGVSSVVFRARTGGLPGGA
jgi:hypothetical protein